MIDLRRRCGECAFYIDGRCKRFPPAKPVDGQPQVSAWQDWCGEFKINAEYAYKQQEARKKEQAHSG